MKTPSLISDLFADLRDRKLLPLVVLLPLAIVAVPLLLGKDAPPQPPAAVSEATVPEGAPSAAVLASAPSLRDYRERLDKLREENPFAGEKLSTSTPPGAGIEETTVGSGGGGSSSSFSETFNETVNESGGGQTTEGDVAVDVDPPDTEDPEDVPDSGGGAQWYEFEVDVEAGPLGETTASNDLGELTVLPSKSNPVAVYLGIARGGKEAVFMVSPEVVGVTGDGVCSPRPSACQLLTLRKGEQARFDYAPDGEAEKFVIKVKDIRFVPVKNPVKEAREAGSVDAEAAAAGARSFIGG